VSTGDVFGWTYLGGALLFTVLAALAAVWDMALKREGLKYRWYYGANDGGEELVLFVGGALIAAWVWPVTLLIACPLLFLRVFRARIRRGVEREKTAEQERLAAIELFRDLRSKVETGSDEYVAFTASIDLLGRS